MANMIDNLGLGFFTEDEETWNGFIGMITSEGKVFKGYHDALYIQRTFKDAEFVIRCEADKDENGKEGYAITGLDTHCTGPCVWNTVVEMDITPEDAGCTERRLLVRNNSEEGGIAVVNLVNADVIPSFLRGENIKMQVVGFPLRIDFYDDEDAMFEDMAEPESGRKILPVEGAVIPAQFLTNHKAGNSDGNNKQDDDINLIRGTVKKIYGGRFAIGEETMETFLRVFVDTRFGEIELEVSKEMLHDNKQEFKVGDQVLAAVILSGDVGIYEYDGGMIRDEEHDLRAVRYTAVKGEGVRLKAILSENCRYTSSVGKWQKEGRDEVAELFDYVSNANNWDYMIHMATLTESADKEFAENAKYKPGKRCLILENENNDYESIMILNYDDDGNICEIDVMNDSRYRFVVDEASVHKDDEEEYEGDSDDPTKCIDIGEAAIYCYETITKKLKETGCTVNEDFEVIPAMYVLADITASSHGLDRAKVANEIIDAMKSAGYLSDSDLKKLDDRADLYGRVIRRVTDPKAFWWVGDDKTLEKVKDSPIDRVILTLGDVLIDERLVNDYEETGGMPISDIFSMTSFTTTMIDTVRNKLLDLCKTISEQ